ncbi:hypothetical protein JK360_29270 [Streptomyces sp. 9-7]|uniref:DUF6924 domain-containing protein n=1 Tax=Streptomyces siderophoricus TaxID=2802281 RepID=A0ABS1N089_9ACTN|nr:hypothetical protein [Streptomyces sp. 9-7]
MATAYVELVDDRRFEGLTIEDIHAALPTEHALPYTHLYLADATTFSSPGLFLLGVDLRSVERTSTRARSTSPRGPWSRSRRCTSGTRTVGGDRLCRLDGFDSGVLVEGDAEPVESLAQVAAGLRGEPGAQLGFRA